MAFIVAAAASLSALLLASSPASSASPPQCGDFDSSGSVAASDALLLLRAAVGLDVVLTCPCGAASGAPIAGEGGAASLVCGDVNDSGSLLASDALFLLRFAVGIDLKLVCPPCVSTTTTTTTSTTLPPGSVVDCGNDLTPSAETCVVTSGDSGWLVEGDVLTPDSVLLGGRVSVDAGGKITCVGCDCAAAAATRLTCADAVVSPALINLHEHVTASSGPPTPDTGERYEDRHQWRRGFDGHSNLSVMSSRGAELEWTELRSIVAGAVSMVGSGTATGLVRNLDRAEPAQEGLNLDQDVFLQTFPLGDSSGERRSTDCDYPNILTRESLLPEDAAFLHVAQGINSFAANEFRCLSSSLDGGEDLALATSVFLDAIPLDPNDFALLASRGSGLVWSPRMHLRVYGATASVTVAARSGVKIGLGTGLANLGSQNLLRELACADSYNANYLDGFFSDAELWAMATATAADLTATAGAIGRLEVDAFGDLVVFAKDGRSAHRAVLGADPEDLALVMRGGVPLYGDAALIASATNADCDEIQVCGAAKRACLVDEIGKSFAALEAELDENAEPIAVCAPQEGEPTCVPMRGVSVNGSSVYTGLSTEEDPDGDGLSGGDDLCPTVFDPILPYQEGSQADSDEDMIGDACDPCPLEGDCP